MGMANKSIESIIIQEIIRLKDNGLSNNQISKSLGKSKTTIIKYICLIEKSGICMKELLELKGAELSVIIPNKVHHSFRRKVHQLIS